MSHQRVEEEEYNFRGRRADERVILVAKFHSWLLMPIFYTWLVLVAISAVALYFFGASRFGSYTVVAMVIIGVLYTFYQWFIWTNGTYIITNQRVIRIEQIGLFNRQISEAEIDRIQEVSTEIKGPIHTLLNFGTVRVQTASNDGKVDLEDVADPYDIQQEIARIRKVITDGSSRSNPSHDIN